jgi:hypothetical protein
VGVQEVRWYKLDLVGVQEVWWYKLGLVGVQEVKWSLVYYAEVRTRDNVQKTGTTKAEAKQFPSKTILNSSWWWYWSKHVVWCDVKKQNE